MAGFTGWTRCSERCRRATRGGSPGRWPAAARPSGASSPRRPRRPRDRRGRRGRDPRDREPRPDPPPRRVGHGHRRRTKLAAAVLLDRRPSWLASFAAWYLRADLWEPAWPLVRALVRAGAIERPEAGLYFDGLLAASREYDWSAKRLLREDPALAEDAWDLIALGGGARDTLTAADAAGASWADALAAALPARPSARCPAGGARRRPRGLPHVVVHEALARVAGDDDERAARVDAWPRCWAPRRRRWSASRSRSSAASTRSPATWISARRWPPRRRRPCARR